MTVRRLVTIRRPRAKPGSRIRSGFGLLESTIAVLLTGLLMVAAMRSLGASKRREAATSDQVRGKQIAADLINEVLRQAYEEPVDTPVFGPESGESGSNRSLFDDVDDYKSYTSTPPKDRGGTALSGFTGWTQSVTVGWANPTTLATTNDTNTGLKKITVTISKSGKTVAQMISYRSVAWVDTIPNPADYTGNHPPVAVATGGPLSANATVNRTFVGTSSSDQDNDPLTYVWNFGDGVTASGSAVAHKYSQVGTYSCTLTVYDGHGGVGIAALTVNVVP